MLSTRGKMKSVKNDSDKILLKIWLKTADAEKAFKGKLPNIAVAAAKE